MSRKSYRQIGVNSRITVETEREGHMSNTGTRFFGMPLEQLVRSNRVGGSLLHLAILKTGSVCCIAWRARVLFFASSPSSRRCRSRGGSAALARAPTLSDSRAAQPETLMGGESSQIIRCQGSKKVWSSDRFAELLAVRRVEDSSE